jgi:ATP-dependent protease ClpP protease subunit
MKKMSFGVNETNSVQIFSRERVNVDYLVALPEEIGSPSLYSPLIALFAFAEEGDTITLEINNGGGYLSTALQICNAMADCKAHITAILNTEGHSAASLIFLSADSCGVGKYASMLCHEGGTGMMGKPSDVRRQMQHYDKMGERVIRDTYEGFLTTDEIDRILDGLELFLDDKEIISRLAIRDDYFKALEADKESVVADNEH